MPYAMGRGPIGPWTDLEGHELPDLNRSVDLPRLAAPGTVHGGSTLLELSQ